MKNTKDMVTAENMIERLGLEKKPKFFLNNVSKRFYKYRFWVGLIVGMIVAHILIKVC